MQTNRLLYGTIAQYKEGSNCSKILAFYFLLKTELLCKKYLNQILYSPVMIFLHLENEQCDQVYQYQGCM